MATTLLRCAICNERVPARDAVYPLPSRGPTHPSCGQRWLDALAAVCDWRLT